MAPARNINVMRQIAARCGGLEVEVNRYFVLYLSTLIALISLDFLFLGVVARGFFSSEDQDCAGDPVLFAVRRGRADLCQRQHRHDLPIVATLRRVVRIVLLRDVRPDVAVATQALELAGRGRRCVVGRDGHRGLIDRRASRCQLAGAEDLRASSSGISRFRVRCGACHRAGQQAGPVGIAPE